MTNSVSIDIAKLLKEKGFEIPTDKYYVPRLVDYNDDDLTFSLSPIKLNEDDFAAPTILDIVMWLYDKHGIWCQVISKNTATKMSFKYEIKRYEWDGCITDDNLHNSPTEAYEAAIEYCLTNLL